MQLKIVGGINLEGEQGPLCKAGCKRLAPECWYWTPKLLPIHVIHFTQISPLPRPAPEIGLWRRSSPDVSQFNGLTTSVHYHCRWKRQHRHPALFLHTPWLLIKWEVLTFWRCVSRRSVVRLNNNMNPSDKCPIGCRITGFGLHNRSIEPPEESGRRRDGIKRRKFCVKLQRHQTEKDKIKLQERYRCFGVQRSEEQREKGKLELGSDQSGLVASKSKAADQRHCRVVIAEPESAYESSQISTAGPKGDTDSSSVCLSSCVFWSVWVVRFNCGCGGNVNMQVTAWLHKQDSFEIRFCDKLQEVNVRAIVVHRPVLDHAKLPSKACRMTQIFCENFDDLLRNGYVLDTLF
ncbi:hypothetical protein GEV33_013655 [Tenebrio molitor]|uniref:Uncharacterized protein n=1 Tax=Tenebrio molitor TaxID=7067 RepID=A0A8J6L765_TENMO|nr:hypothetical protein GEV33_013655 [Tenebrio molitor]